MRGFGFPRVPVPFYNGTAWFPPFAGAYYKAKDRLRWPSNKRQPDRAVPHARGARAGRVIGRTAKSVSPDGVRQEP